MKVGEGWFPMFSVIENNENFLLINKHPGFSFHEEAEQEGMAGVLRSRLKIKTLFTVHRLDRITSGLLLFAKKKECAQELSRQFRQRTVEKYYIALSDRVPKKKQGLIKGDMERSRRGGWKLARTYRNPAVTQFISRSLGNGLRLFLLKPHTGKTHQIRAALKSIGSPVLGDPLYSKAKEECSDRGYLHAYGLRFFLQRKKFEYVLLPDRGEHFKSREFLEEIIQYEKPWELKWPLVKQITKADIPRSC